MGASGKWVKTLIPGTKKPETDASAAQEKSGQKEKKWKLWRSASGDLGTCKGGFGGLKMHGVIGVAYSSEASDAPSRNDTLSAAMAAVVRAQPKNFKALKREWAAIRIQAAFRAFLARKALKALKGIVKMQAIARGRQVRKQAALTLRCMQALVRVQARVRARRVRMSLEGQAVQKLLNERRIEADLLKDAEEGWCDGKGTLEEIKTKIRMRQQGAFRRERALAYSLAQKQSKSTPSAAGRANITIHIDNNSSGWSWLERWMAAKPWESRLIEESQSTGSDSTAPSPKSFMNLIQGTCSESSKASSVRVQKNNITTHVSAKPPANLQGTRSSSSPSSGFLHKESTASSSICTSNMTPVSGPTAFTFTSEGRKERSCRRPNYMNLTESSKAKRRTESRLSPRTQSQSVDDSQFSRKLVGLSNRDFQSCAGSSDQP